ncbi:MULTISPECIES: hypothetical protein [unclassified Marinobacterium]|uniref:hypothetical protein n=1 Tax=unclassified Marinobacterium TaxID=2644139 RepID=UPI001569FA6A|nr:MULTISPECIES: hypothetical protein [unclassified Marinobacterium]NRP10380.1 hypothetical protein [Marinobacterium sp. xm-g-48]NRP83479.1 hypothetical protein [Marinobacterium sp. xm-d-509]
MMTLGVFYPEFEVDRDYFPSEFHWLKNDFSDEQWKVQFGGFGKIANLNFDFVVGPNRSLLNSPVLLSDLKRLLALVGQFSKSKPGVFGLVNNKNGTAGYASGSRLRGLLGDFVRIHRTIRHLGYESLSEVKPKHLREILEYLADAEQYGLDYFGKLRTYEEEQLALSDKLKEVPVSIRRDRKSPSSVDWPSVYLCLGLSKGVISTSPAFKNARDAMDARVGECYPTEFWLTPYIRDESGEPTKTTKSRLRDLITALRMLIAASSIEGLMDDGFKFTLDEFDEAWSNNLVSQAPHAVGTGRTANIEVEDFLRLLDGCVRWVTHYADELFDLERQIEELKNKYEARSEPTRLLSGELRSLTQRSEWVGCPASPFPLSGLNNAKSAPEGAKRVFNQAEIRTIAQAVANGSTAAQVRDEHLPHHDRVNIERAMMSFRHRNSHLSTTDIGIDHALYTLLPLACKVILLAFTAGREESIDCLEAGCISEDRGMKFIRMWIPKTGLGWQKLPAVEIHRLAVETLERLSARRRARTGEKTLFKFDSEELGFQDRGLNWQYNIPRLAQLCGIDVEGLTENLNEHQFRRFFAIMYFYRYEVDADFEALSYYLRHITYEMTAVYVSEKEAGRILKQVQAEKVQRYARLAAANDSGIGGGFAEILREELANKLGVMDPSEIEDADLMFEDEEDAFLFDFTTNGDVCFGRTPRFKSRSKCKVTDEAGEDHIALYKASDRLCGACPNQLCISQIKDNMITHQHEEYIFRSTRVLDAAIARSEAES